MKRILFISQHLNRAGTEAFMMSVFRGVDKSRFQVDFLVYNWKQTDYSQEVEAAGNKVWRVPSRRESPIGWYCSLNKFFKEHAKEYAAIHFCGNGLTAIAPIVFAYFYGVPIRISHSQNSSVAGLHNRLLHLLQRGIAKRLTTHHFACSSLAAKWFFGDSPAVIIKYGIDTQKFSFNQMTRDKVRLQNNISPTTKVIGHIGRFEAEKNHTFLVEVFAEYCKTQTDTLLLLVGKGSLMDVIKDKAKRLNIHDKICFMGERSDVSDLLQAMDFFLMPSTFEGLPFVLIEAQCAGLPCLVSETINQDICLTDNLKRYSLDCSAKEWAKEITNLLTSYKRKSEHKAIEEKGCSAKKIVSYLEKVYDGEDCV